MSDPRRPAGYDPNGPHWAQPTEPPADYYPGVDPAYGNYYSYPSYIPPTTTRPTEPLPPYWTQTQYPPPVPRPAEPPPPKSPRWLWLAAGAAVVFVICLVLALMIANGSSREDTLVAPLPPMPQPSPQVPLPTIEIPTWTPTAPTPPRRNPTITTEPTVPVVPPPIGEVPPTTQAAATETVVYNVSGVGRAISITYVDTGGMLQMEFNVVLPWSREVVLTPSASRAASVTVINVGREINCSITLNGTVTRQRTGSGLTICSSLGS